jgi:hypothetical protein
VEGNIKNKKKIKKKKGKEKEEANEAKHLITHISLLV